MQRLVTIYAFALLTLLLPGSTALAQSTAFDTDCHSVGGDFKTGYQFIATCAGHSRSPDRKFVVVARPYRDKQPPVEVQNARGSTIATLNSLSDDMPFQLFWAPNSRWFFVNHHVGSFMDRMQLFEIADGKVFERTTLVRAAQQIATHRYPCLPVAGVLPNGARWMADGHRIVMVTISRPDACSDDSGRRRGSFKPLWMIGDARSGRVDRTSVRANNHNDGLQEPSEGAYARP